MRLLTSWAVAGLAGLASAAASEPADVYILSKSAPSSSSPQIPRQVARDIVLSRVGAQAKFGDLPNSISTEDALSYVSQYGKVAKGLFGTQAVGSVPSQLVVLIEGVTKSNAKPLKEEFESQGSKPAFTIADPPSAKANKYFLDRELASVAGSCDVATAVDPFSSCWTGLSLVVKYDAAKNPEILDTLINSLTRLRAEVTSNALEAVFVLLPESSRSPEHGYWTTNPPSELRRRDETPISDTNSKSVIVAEAQGEDLSALPFVAQLDTTKLNSGCFTSYNSCVSATNNCTGHGTCLDRYAMGTSGGQSGDKQCFICYCGTTSKHPDQEDDFQHTHWGGTYCQKIDVSSQFWLLVGTTVILIGLVGGSIALLFNVGEEKLPGVIGAGVSRAK
ncbi:hypothetical protein BD289DRAFT_506612 [Coniella lustricola]|uniref:Vacuolar sorting protein Vps3844 C-terminal domain-containing protein n=1 Tax=Coniella lustricola TaxID=2025994 RepID=A0A2T3A5T4_9PEZI|nr:hypothetical protein BD289DRAFT_506612 [Coniella lustricola]